MSFYRIFQGVKKVSLFIFEREVVKIFSSFLSTQFPSEEKRARSQEERSSAFGLVSLGIRFYMLFQLFLRFFHPRKKKKIITWVGFAMIWLIFLRFFLFHFQIYILYIHLKLFLLVFWFIYCIFFFFHVVLKL